MRKHDKFRSNPYIMSSVLLHEIIEVLDYRLQLNLDHEKICQLEAGFIYINLEIVAE